MRFLTSVPVFFFFYRTLNISKCIHRIVVNFSLYWIGIITSSYIYLYTLMDVRVSVANYRCLAWKNKTLLLRWLFFYLVTRNMGECGLWFLPVQLLFVITIVDIAKSQVIFLSCYQDEQKKTNNNNNNKIKRKKTERQ